MGGQLRLRLLLLDQKPLAQLLVEAQVLLELSVELVRQPSVAVGLLVMVAVVPPPPPWPHHL